MTECRPVTMQREGPGVYVIFVFPISNYQRFKNAMNRNSPILKNYTGSLVCSAPEVKVVEGHWPTNRTVAILQFESEWYAKQYLGSDPLVRQPDFMDGLDVVIVQLKEIPPRDKQYFVIADVRVHDPDRFVNEYSPQTSGMKDQGKVVVTAACPEPIKYRGTWKPYMIIINQWSSEAEYFKFYNSDEYQPLKELRQQITLSNVIGVPNHN